ncbi:MAG: hypothetical protein LIO93_06625 [Bacteroidales bacterium]|nr:hypothetical protein [Bacteroidales bacterium]
MVKTKLASFLFLLVALPVALYSQNINTLSPYTQYGYGQLADPSFGSQRAMGGIGYGLRKSEMINPLNPASFSAVDSMTFMIDFGVKAQIGWLNEGDKSARDYTAGLEYLAMQFPLAKKLGMGVGLAPVSYVGYNFRTWQDQAGNDDVSYPVTASGKGGLNKVYATLSYNFFDRLSLGVNVGYLFGDITKSRYTLPTSTSHTIAWNDSLRSSGLVYEIGAQYRIPLGNRNEVVVGAVYTPKTRIPTKYAYGEVAYSGSEITGNPVFHSTKDSVFHMPETYAVGISYSKLNKFTAGADFQYQRWEDAKYFNVTDSLKNRMKINVGIEYIPDHMASNVFRKMRYRAGGYYTNSYVQVGGYGYKDYGFTVGFGIPMVDRRSFINMAFEYNIVSPEKRPNAVMVDEKYFRFTLSYTFNELWFFKRKLQ